MKISELEAILKELKEKHGDLEVVHFEKDDDRDVGIDDLRQCTYTPNVDNDYYDMRKDTSNKEVILIY